MQITKPIFPPLGLDNWQTWSLKMRAYLTCLGLWQTIEPAQGSTVAPDKCEHARSVLLLNVEDVNLQLISKSSTASEAWKALKAVYSAHSKAREALLEQQLFQLQLRKGERIQEYVSRTQQLVNAYEEASGGTALPEDKVVSRLLHGLPANPYATVCQTLFAQAPFHSDALSLVHVVPQLLLLEAKQQQGGRQARDSDALLARPAKQQHRGRGGRGAAATAAGSSSSRQPAGQRAAGKRPEVVPGTDGKTMPSIQCHKCHKYGHVQRVCPTAESAGLARMEGIYGMIATTTSASFPAASSPAASSSGGGQREDPSWAAWEDLSAPPNRGCPPTAISSNAACSHDQDRWTSSRRACSPARFAGLPLRPDRVPEAAAAPSPAEPGSPTGQRGAPLSQATCAAARPSPAEPAAPARLAGLPLLPDNVPDSAAAPSPAEPGFPFCHKGAPLPQATSAAATPLPAEPAAPARLAGLPLRPVCASNPTATVLAVAHGHGPTTWVLDSGATTHITPHEHVFAQIKPSERGTVVHLANGEVEPVRGVGTVHLRVQQHCSDVTLVLKEVLWVPGASHSLLSLGRMQQMGAEVHGKGNTMRIQTAQGSLQAQRQNSLFCFKAECAMPPVEHSLTLQERKGAAAMTWHRRLGHLGWKNLALMPSMVEGMDGLTKEELAAASGKVCAPCQAGQMPKPPFQPSGHRAEAPLDLVHTDVVGKLTPETRGGGLWIVTLLDDYSGLSVVGVLPSKDRVSSWVRQQLTTLQTRTERKVKVLRSDNGREYMGELDQWLEQNGTQHQKSAPHTPEQNGRAERLNQTLMSRMRAMLHDAQLPQEFWGEAVSAASHLRNLAPTKGRTATPWEMFWGSKPSVSHLRVYGCKAFVQVPAALRSKLDPVAQEGWLVGYGLEQGCKAWRVWVPDVGKVVLSRNVRFDEATMRAANVQQEGPQLEREADEQAAIDPVPHARDDAAPHAGGAAEPAGQGGQESSDPYSSDDEGEDLQNQPPQQPERRYPARERRAPAHLQQPAPAHANAPASANAHAPAAEQERRYPARNRQPPREWAGMAVVSKEPWLAAYGVSGEPQSYKEAMRSPDAARWKDAMDEEMQSQHSNGTWQLAPTPVGVRPLGVRWVYRMKKEADGSVRYKARLVAKGFGQRAGVDYEEVFAPVSKHTSLRALCAKAAAEDLHLHQIDVKTAFLNGELEEEVWMVQPEGYEQGDNSKLSCRLLKALYGLKQAPRAWHAKLHEALEEMGAVVAESDPGLYSCSTPSGLAFMLVYVDDILVAAKQLTAAQWVKQQLLARFDARDLGEARIFVGLTISRDRVRRTLTLTQEQQARALVEKFGLGDAKGKLTPFTAGECLRKEGQQLEDAAAAGYREAVGSLMYLSNCTRPDLTHGANALARFMAAPTERQLTAAKGLLRYLGSTSTLGITYRQGKSNGELVGYGDADYAGDVDTRRSTTGYAFMIHGGAISWNSRLQPTVAVSTAEAEYMAATSAVREALWLQQLQRDLQLGGSTAAGTLIFTDNIAALALLRNPIVSQRAKHIDVLYHFARERVQKGQVQFQYCPTGSMLADIFTKQLPRDKFVCLRDELMGKA